MMRLTPLLLTAVAAHTRYCEKKGSSFLQMQAPTTDVSMPYDGYFSVGCFIDESPDKVSVKYGEFMESEGKVAKKMTPTACFNFCRYNATDFKFFKVYPSGPRTECECTLYPTLSAGAGGQGDCTAICEGDSSQMCGDTGGKASIFEMHRCNDSSDEATKVFNAAKSKISEVRGKIAIGARVVDAVTELAKEVNVPDARKAIFDETSKLSGGVKKANNTCNDLQKDVDALEAAKDATPVDLVKLDAAMGKVSAKQEEIRQYCRKAMAWWNSHSLNATIADAGLYAQCVKQTKEPLRVDWQVTPPAVKKKAGDFEGYLVVGDALGTPFFTMLGDGKLAAEMCFQVCQITTGCAAANFLHQQGTDTYGGVCNLKKSVEQVNFVKTVDSKRMLTGFINNVYYNLKKDKIKWNTANMIEAEQAAR